MSNKGKFRLHIFVGILYLVAGAIWLETSIRGNKPPEELYDPGILFGNGLINLIALATSQPFHPSVDKVSRSKFWRQVATFTLQVLAVVLGSVSVAWWWESKTLQALVNSVAALATGVVVLFPFTNPLAQWPDRRRDNEFRRRVLSRIQDDVKENWKRYLIPEVALPIKFSLSPDLINPLIQLERLRSAGSIVDVYDSSGGRLLILGEAGAGKTTFGLEIINTIAIRAQADLSKYPIPILLRELSTWRSGQSFDEWVVSQLSRVYRVPADIGTKWIHIGGDLALVLDGLEQIRNKEVRRQFIDAVNDYAQRYTSIHTPIVLLSRTEEYKETEVKLVFTTAIEVNPLTKGEIIECLVAGGPDLASVRQVLEVDQDLFELARQPFWLGVISSAYVGANSRDLTEFRQGEIRSRILDHFIQRRWDSVHMDPNTVNHANRWLGFIATNLKEQSTNIFFVDELDRNWLETFSQKTVYRLVPSILAVLLGLIVACIAYTIDIRGDFDAVLHRLQNTGNQITLAETYSKILRNVILAFVYSYIYLVIIWQPTRPQKWRTIAFVHGAILTILTSILAVYGVLLTNREFLAEAGRSPVWSSEFIQSAQKFIPQILETLILGSYLGLFTAALTGALMIGLSARAKHTIGSFEWSWPGAISGLKPGLVVALCFSLIIGMGLGSLMWQYLQSEIQFIREMDEFAIMNAILNGEIDLTSFMLWSLVSNLSTSFISISIGFFSTSMAILVIAYSYIYFAIYIVPTCVLLYSQEGRIVSTREFPAHALRNWARNSVYALLLVGVGSSVILLLHNTIVQYTLNSLDSALTGEQSLPFFQTLISRLDLVLDLAPGALQFGLPFGVAAGLTLGGKMLIKHYVTRAILVRWRLLPWDAIGFLDQTTSLMITKRSSGGYAFYHQLIHDYFAQNYESNYASEVP